MSYNTYIILFLLSVLSPKNNIACLYSRLIYTRQFSTISVEVFPQTILNFIFPHHHILMKWQTLGSRPVNPPIPYFEHKAIKTGTHEGHTF